MRMAVMLLLHMLTGDDETWASVHHELVKDYTPSVCTSYEYHSMSRCMASM